MQVIQVRPVKPLRRWCRACGMSGPASQPGCANCGPLQSATRAVRDVVANTGENVQHNVTNIENVEVQHLVEQLSAPPPPRSSFFHRFFMFTCAVAMWCGILVTGTITLVVVGCVVAAVMKAHG